MLPVSPAGDRAKGITVSASSERFRAGKLLWSADEDAELRRLYPHEPTAVVARQLRRTLSATYGRARLLGLAKSAAYLASPHAYRFRRGYHAGWEQRFQKGHMPANKGLRRPGWHRGRMRETQFKPGMRSGKAAQHYMPVGSTRLIDGYVYRKVSDVPNVPYAVNWKPAHHLLWTQANGPVPPGHALIFRNGDKFDIRLDNLQLITRRELMARNSVHTLPPALARTVQLLGALNRKIRRGIQHAQQD
jgi:hypothetical protein